MYGYVRINVCLCERPASCVNVYIYIVQIENDRVYKIS